MSRSAFSVGGVTVELRGADKEHAHKLLSHFFALSTAIEKVAEPHGVHLQLHTAPLPAELSHVIYQAKALTVTRTGTDTTTGFSLRCGASQLQVTPGSADAHCFLAPDFGRYSPFEQREFFLLGLLMLLRPFGYYGLHACGLERHGKGLLIVGASGSGKTTTSLNLIRQGWRYLSDDAVLLATPAAGRVEASAFRRGFSCTPKTLEHIPELSGSAEFGDPDGKRIVYPETTFGSFVPTCTPSVIIFPTVTAAATTRLRPLAPTQSLLRLCQQSAGIMTDTAVSQRQLEVLRALVGQTLSLELQLGQDALEDSALTHTLLIQASKSREEPICVS